MTSNYEEDAARRVECRREWLAVEMVQLNDAAWLVLADQLIEEHNQMATPTCLLGIQSLES